MPLALRSDMVAAIESALAYLVFEGQDFDPAAAVVMAKLRAVLPDKRTEEPDGPVRPPPAYNPYVDQVLAEILASKAAQREGIET